MFKVKSSFFILAFLFIALPLIAENIKDKAKVSKDFVLDMNSCYDCHDIIQELHYGSAHADVTCDSCHDKLAEHIEDFEVRPTTDMSWEACAVCHEDQHKTFMMSSYEKPARDEKSQPTNRAPIWFDKLMYPHGFTKEHALTRSHVNMLLDQYVVDRAFGGRFQPKNGWSYVLETGKVWDILVDTHPEVKGQKVFLPQSAIAANPICINCKTMDHILDWPYMGDPGTGAKWDRTSDVVEMAKSTNHAMNCFFCHDPHSAKPRIVRDAMIEALSNPQYGPTVWHNDPNRTKIRVIEMGERGFTRKIALLDKPDSRLLCGQCHVEYNCNTGINPATGEVTGYESRLTNHFPLKDVLHLYDHYYNILKMADFKNKFDGAYLWKGQHPEFETYYESVHSKLGVGCADCHMVSAYGDKKFTSHFARSPRKILKHTCLSAGCHEEWTEEQALYTIDSIQAYTKGRMRKAEFWLATLIDTIDVAHRSGVSEQELQKARRAHGEAHLLWEYWTAENSDGFHNPELARESLTKSITISQQAIEKLRAELDKKLTKKK